MPDGHDKIELRAEGRRRRRALTSEERRAASEAASAHLCDLDEVRRSGTVALYAALPDELDLASAAATLVDRGVRVLLPRMADDAITLAPFGPAGATPGYRGVSEPSGPTVDAAEVDAVVVPGVAFDRDGNRLGQGGGHYDRLLARLPPRTDRIGVCFACQVFAAVPREGHDRPVGIVVTERGVIRVTSPRSGPRPSGWLPDPG